MIIFNKHKVCLILWIIEQLEHPVNKQAHKNNNH